MKKILFLILPAIAGIMSCSNDDPTSDLIQEQSIDKQNIELRGPGGPCIGCIQSEPAIHFPFDGCAVDVKKNLQGRVEGATLASDRFGVYYSAYYFDGIDDRIIVDNIGSYLPKEEITVTMWVKSLESGYQFQLMLMPDNSRFAVSINMYHAGYNTVFWDYGWSGAGGNAPGRLYYRPEPFDTGWHHYAFVSSIYANYMKIFKDGRLIAQKSQPLRLLSPEGKKLYIGQGNEVASSFHGYIDDVRIYEGALIESAIEDIFQGRR